MEMLSRTGLADMRRCRPTVAGAGDAFWNLYAVACPGMAENLSEPGLFTRLAKG